MYRDQEQRNFARQLRNQPTPAEKRLWHFLRAGKLGVKFRRQAAIGAYLVDFVCFSHKLIVELDGPQHLEAKATDHDNRRSTWLAACGFRVLRFRNQALDENIWQVVEEIQCALNDAGNVKRQPPPQLSPQRGGSRKNRRAGEAETGELVPHNGGSRQQIQVSGKPIHVTHEVQFFSK